MSTAKRSKRRQPEAKSASPLPASKRLKTTKDAHVPAARSGLDFLVDGDARQGKNLEAKLTNGVPRGKTTRLDESRAVIAPDSREDADADTEKVSRGSQDDVIDISSADESSGEDEDGEDGRVLPNGAHSGAGGQQALVNGHVREGAGNISEEDAVARVKDVDMAEDDEQEAEEPSFGDILQARHPQPIDVRAAFPNPMADRQALVPTSGSKALAAPPGTSLGTVLTQALKTNDKDLLESCFETTDLPSIRATIQRLQSQHVATLLHRLAERIHKRPGRTGNLLAWVQWSLVAHGGYLATQPDLVRKLRSLSQVVRDRANGLQPLLHLKGKLDMLAAQLELRRNIQAASRAANADEDVNEEGVVYVEGQNDDWSDSDAAAGDEHMDTRMLDLPPRPSNAEERELQVNGTASDEEDDSESNDDMSNGADEVDGDVGSDAEDDEPGMFDLEAEVTDDDNGDEEDDSEGDNSEPESGSELDISDDDASEASGVKQPNPTILDRKR